MSRPVTVGVDGSEGSGAAVDWAADEAAVRGDGLRLVYATRWAEHQLGAMKVSHDDRADAAEGVLAETERRVGSRQPDVALTVDEVEDAPVSVLLAAAARAELLVVGSHGLGSVRGFIVGSVGQEVVSEAQRPVVLVRPGYEKDGSRASGSGTARKVVLGLDVNEAKDELLDFAFDFAGRHGVPLEIVHTWHDSFVHRADAAAKDERAAALAGAVRPFRDRYPATEVAEVSAPGRAAEHLIEASSDARLVIVGRRRAARGSHLGSVTHAVIHHASCPVAVVPHA
ncbi:universal stress protein [Streptomyces sp. SP18ES09]|uniref:universal stress protein n=1 Tax=Streptomyces sp. SP18ES09 TaxID=3002532 RepID=UPI002E77A1F4|nr:universal stress protein [Streptomyces sp. SP18ES09]MEE1815832.1 universal stress protein [Streptomyces sp. SP18ES09]